MTLMAAPPQPTTRLRQVGSVTLVDRVEPCLDFWVDRLGFEIRIKIEDNDGVEFAIVGLDDVELAYRAHRSLGDDHSAEEFGPPSTGGLIHFEVEDLDHLLSRLDGVEMLSPARESIFGREVFCREPSGRVVGFAAIAS